MARLRLVLMSLAGTLLLAACSGPDILNALTPRSGFAVARDVAYGAHPRLRLDRYVPEGISDDTPVVVFFYGGGWESGSKEDYFFAGQAFASRGYIAVIPDYRLYPEVRFPTFLEDAAAAVAWIHARERRSDGSARPIYLVGHSAGAYIAAMLALDGRWLGGGGLSVCETVAAVIGLAGPYDFLPLTSPTLKAIFGPEETLAATQPINYVGRDLPPMLLATGSDDTTVRPANVARLAARVRDMGGKVETRTYDGVSHVFLVAALSRPFRGIAPVLDDISTFIDLHRRPGPSCRPARASLDPAVR